jgi:hypothetical protein
MLRKARLGLPDGSSPRLLGAFLTPEGTVLSIGGSPSRKPDQSR